jgi:putative lipoprotein (rSAM/lipoprotein system)
MKKHKLQLLSHVNKCLALILSVLGFATACEPAADEYGTPPVEYGSPFATFIVKGKVSSSITQKGIKNIQVIMENDTAYSDSSGNYSVQMEGLPESRDFLVKYNDIDSVSNGLYQKKDTLIEFKNPEFTGSTGGWNQGSTEKEVNLNLDPKE